VFISNNATRIFETATFDHDHITWDGSSWFGGNGTNEAPDNTDDVKDMTISGSSVSINNALDVDQLTVGAGGGFTLGTDGKFTVYGTTAINGSADLLSTASGTASLITFGATSGQADIERFIPAYPETYFPDEGWHLLSSPVSNQAIQPEFVPSGNPLPLDFDFYKWDETSYTWVNTRDGSQNWNTSFEPNFVVTRGYLVDYYINDVTKTFSGDINSGDYNFDGELSYTPQDNPGWCLLGNPYPSAFNWDDVSRTNVDGGVYVFDGNAGQYRSYNNGLGLSFNGEVPQENGFFVHTNDLGAASLTIPNISRIHTANGFYKSANTVDNVLLLTVEGNNRADQTYVRFEANATENWDGEWDAAKLYGVPSAPQLYTKAPDGRMLSINSTPWKNEQINIPLSLKVGADDIYTISLSEATINESSNIWLKDLTDGTMYDLRENPNVNFIQSPENSADRFMLIINAITGISDPDVNNIRIFSYGDKVFVNVPNTDELLISVEDILGRNVFRKTFEGSLEYNFHIPQNGFFIVTAEQGIISEATKIAINE
jgi:hypothetical protein